MVIAVAAPLVNSAILTVYEPVPKPVEQIVVRPVNSQHRYGPQVTTYSPPLLGLRRGFFSGQAVVVLRVSDVYSYAQIDSNPL